MGRLNDVLKFAVLFVNCIYFFVGVGVIVVCIWFLTRDSTQDLDPTTYLTLAVLLLCSGILMFFLSLLGCIGTIFQTDRTGLCQGRRTLSIYQLVLLGVTVGHFYTSVYTYNTLIILEDVETLLHDQNNVLYDSFELSYAKKFNALYFSTTTEQSRHGWFWGWIDDNCPAEMRGSNCDQEVLADACPDQAACDRDATDSKCAYDKCREACVQLVISQLGPFASYSVFVSLFSVCLMVLTCLLICYNPRDSQHEILVKSGAVESAPPLGGATPPAAKPQHKPAMV